MGLPLNRKGYAVMNDDLSAYSLDGENLEHLKKYCRKGQVIAERIPNCIGFNFRIFLIKWYKPFYFGKYHAKNILWFHFDFGKEYKHKTGRIVYIPE